MIFCFVGCGLVFALGEIVVLFFAKKQTGKQKNVHVQILIEKSKKQKTPYPRKKKSFFFLLFHPKKSLYNYFVYVYICAPKNCASVVCVFLVIFFVLCSEMLYWWDRYGVRALMQSKAKQMQAKERLYNA